MVSSLDCSGNGSSGHATFTPPQTRDLGTGHQQRDRRETGRYHTVHAGIVQTLGNVLSQTILIYLFPRFLDFEFNRIITIQTVPMNYDFKAGRYYADYLNSPSEKRTVPP